MSSQPLSPSAPQPLSLYIHWPFCASKCPYCDFNSHVRENIDEAAWLKAYLSEMEHWAARLGPRCLSTVFFGGGTPSLMNPKTVEKIIDKAVGLFGTGDQGLGTGYSPPSPQSLAPSPEITLEANPTSSEAQKFRDLKSAGVNRLSLGVQALDDAALTFLGRKHNTAEAVSAVAAAAQVFPRFSFDLIYARKGQSVKDWEQELRRALPMADGHLSLYQLTLEPGTGFAARAALGEVFQAQEDEQIEMFEITQSVMEQAGLPGYEISNHAKPGQECRHNLAYWQYGEWLGIGPGAHGRVWGSGTRDWGLEKEFPSQSLVPSPQSQCHAQTNIRAPEAWLKSVQTKGHGTESCIPLPAREAQEEALLMGLRLRQGLCKSRWQTRFGTPLDNFLDAGKKRALLAAGLIEEDAEYLRATPNGALKLNSVTAVLIAN
ncbi:MAG: coproporphyrinogen III oxidase [Proteobacteria bacterium]|nr:coproporphyrinogen III oxidase [Pseudomonadota bacterium]